MALGERPSDGLGNSLSALLVRLPVHLADPLERLRAAREASLEAMRTHELLGNQLNEWADLVSPPLFAGAVAALHAARARRARRAGREPRDVERAGSGHAALLRGRARHGVPSDRADLRRLRAEPHRDELRRQPRHRRDRLSRHGARGRRDPARVRGVGGRAAPDRRRRLPLDRRRVVGADLSRGGPKSARHPL